MLLVADTETMVPALELDLKFHATTSVPPLVPPITRRSLRMLSSWVDKVQSTMHTYREQAKDLCRSIALMHESTVVALANLQLHAKSVKKAVFALNTLAAKDLGDMEEMLQRSDGDLYVLRHTPAHPSFAELCMQQSESSDGRGTDSEAVMLADLVELSQMALAVDQGRTEVQRVQNEYINAMNMEFQLHVDLNDLATEIEHTDLQPSLDSHDQVHRACRDTQVWADELKKRCEYSPQSSFRGDAAISDLVSSLYMDAQKLCERETEAVDALNCLVSDHNELLYRHLNLVQDVSSLQSDFAELSSLVADVDALLQSPPTDAFRQLSRLKRMCCAYAVTLVEAVRRSEFTTRFLSRAQNVAELMAKVSQFEVARRHKYTTEVAPLLACSNLNLESPPPILDITTRRRDSSKILPCSRADVDELLEQLEKLELELQQRGSLCRPATEVRAGLSPWLQMLESGEQEFKEAAKKELGLAEMNESEEDLHSELSSQHEENDDGITRSETWQRQLAAAQSRIQFLEAELKTRTTEWHDDRQRLERAVREAGSKLAAAGTSLSPATDNVMEQVRPWLHGALKLQRHLDKMEGRPVSEMPSLETSDAVWKALQASDPTLWDHIQAKLDVVPARTRQDQRTFQREHERHAKELWLSRTYINVQTLEVGSLAIFVPARQRQLQQGSRVVWTAVQVQGPLPILVTDAALETHLQSQDWLLARVVKLERRISDDKCPYGLSLSTPYILVTVDGWSSPSALLSSVAERHRQPPRTGSSVTFFAGPGPLSTSTLSQGSSRAVSAPWQSETRRGLVARTASVLNSTSPTTAMGEFSKAGRSPSSVLP